MSDTPKTDAMWAALGHAMDSSDALIVCETSQALEREVATERAAREAAEAKLAKIKSTAWHGFGTAGEVLHKIRVDLDSTEPPALLKELDELRNADTSWRGYVMEMCAHAGMVTSSEDIAEENLSELAEWVRQLKAENRKLADTVIGWSQLVERAESAEKELAGLRHQAQLDTDNIERIRAAGERDVDVVLLQVAKDALTNLPLAVSSIGPCSGTKDWNDGYNAAARHATGVAKLKCEEALSQINGVEKVKPREGYCQLTRPLKP